MAFSSESPGENGYSEALQLLLLEDDVLLRDRVLAPKLRQFGFRVATAGSLVELNQAAQKQAPDLVLLDIGLPDTNGFDVARKLRAEMPATGIIILTGRPASADRVRGLTEGADAYLCKPVEIDVLVATLHSVARRLKPQPRIDRSAWRLSSDNWLLISPMGNRVKLSKTERRLLEKLMQHPNEVMLRETLIASVTDDVSSFDPHRLDSLIHRLRRKVLATLSESLPLDAVHGTGYMLTT